MQDEKVYRVWFTVADAGMRALALPEVVGWPLTGRLSHATADGDGRVTGADAVAFFTKSGLPREMLSKVLLPRVSAQVMALAQSPRLALAEQQFDRLDRCG